MMRMSNIIAATMFLLLFTISCSQTGDSEIERVVVVGSLSPDSVSKWNSYVMSPMYANVDPLEHQPDIQILTSLGGDDNFTNDPPFYLPGYFCSKGDTLFVTDLSTEKLISMGFDGSVYWSIGGSGEGPGYFNGISRLAVCGDSLFVCNNRNCRIDIISTDGEYVNSVPILRPQDVVSVSDSLIVILSKQEPGGDCHVFNLNSDSMMYSFGQAPWHNLLANNPSPGAVFGEFLADSFIVYGGQEQTECYLYNVYTGDPICSFSRELPAEEFRPDLLEHNGSTTTVYVPMTSDLFVTPSGNISIVFPTYLNDGCFMDPLAAEYDFAPVTIIDTYANTGEYLYSYSLPDSLVGEIELLDDGRLIARQLPTATLHIYQATW